MLLDQTQCIHKNELILPDFIEFDISSSAHKMKILAQKIQMV